MPNETKYTEVYLKTEPKTYKDKKEQTLLILCRFMYLHVSML